ncbi:hypothetical protein E4U55_005167 [Claviceps digitariae]|nr:hypothetical protein E4U55_005167 [Claviceps digitariae]
MAYRIVHRTSIAKFQILKRPGQAQNIWSARIRSRNQHPCFAKPCATLHQNQTTVSHDVFVIIGLQAIFSPAKDPASIALLTYPNCRWRDMVVAKNVPASIR